MAENGIQITNFNQVVKHIKNLDLTDRKNLKDTRRVLKKPFLVMRRNSLSNLKTQGSIRSGNLYKGLSVGSSFKKSKGYFSIAFGARTKATLKGVRKKGAVNHFHLVNTGTRKRYHKSNGKYVGAVGKGKSKRSNMNPSFRVGFADRAIKPELGVKMETLYINEFNKILSKVKTQGV